MSISSTEHLDKLAFILYDRPAGRNVIGCAIEKIEQLRADNERQRAEIERLRLQVETGNLLKAEIMMLRKALEPFAQLYLWPDDMGEDMAHLIRSEDHWSEEANEDADSDVSIKRKYIRAARHVLEGKP